MLHVHVCVGVHVHVHVNMYRLLRLVHAHLHIHVHVHVHVLHVVYCSCTLLFRYRRLYNRKCGELVDEKTMSEQAFSEQLDSAKQTMKVRRHYVSHQRYANLILMSQNQIVECGLSFSVFFS